MSEIKGSCEHCGFAFRGNVSELTGQVKCPACGQITQNFDESYVIDDLERVEGYRLNYKPSRLQVVA